MKKFVILVILAVLAWIEYAHVTEGIWAGENIVTILVWLSGWCLIMTGYYKGVALAAALALALLAILFEPTRSGLGDPGFHAGFLRRR